MNRLVKTVNQIDSLAQQFIVGSALLRPSSQDLIDRVTLRAPELAILKVCIVNRLRNEHHPLIVEPKCLAERLERAVITLVAKSAAAVHVERNGLGVLSHVIAKDEPGLRIDEAGDEPRR